MLFKKSHYTIVIVKDDDCWLVNTLGRSIISCDHDMVSLYNSAPSVASIDEYEKLFGKNALVDMISGCFLLPDATVELEIIRHRVALDRTDPSTVGFVIAPTLNCNCSCNYCFEKGVRKSVDTLSEERLIEFVTGHIGGKKSATLQWFGGEPLAKVDFVEAVTRAIRLASESQGIVFSASAVTNGVFLTEEVASRLAAAGLSRVQVTLEGDRETHDAVRFEKGRKGTYDRIIENIRHAGRHLRVNLRIHVRPSTLNSVFDLIDQLANDRIGSSVSEVYFAPLFDFQTKSKRQQFVHEDDKFFSMKTFSEWEPDLYRRSTLRGLPLPSIFDQDFSVCTAVRSNTFVVDPEGLLQKCYFDLGDSSLSYGDVNVGITNAGNLVKWEEFVLPRDDDCRQCKMLPVCLGGCSVKWNKLADKSTICDTLRYNVDEMIPIFYPS